MSIYTGSPQHIQVILQEVQNSLPPSLREAPGRHRLTHSSTFSVVILKNPSQATLKAGAKSPATSLTGSRLAPILRLLCGLSLCFSPFPNPHPQTLYRTSGLQGLPPSLCFQLGFVAWEEGGLVANPQKLHSLLFFMEPDQICSFCKNHAITNLVGP